MKISAMFLLALTSLILLTVVIFSALDFSLSWVFLLTTFGQVLLVVTVYRVLKDNYTTDKTFEDFYEDHPISENYR
jgi:membrane protein implicated in regulation of membrane protease activity